MSTAGVTRFEYIGPSGREIVLYGKFEVHFQDGGRTVKVFGSEPANVNNQLKTGSRLDESEGQ